MQVTFGTVIGGLERVVMELCRHIDPTRYRLSLCCTGERGLLADILEAEGVRVLVCSKQSKAGKYLRGLELARIFSQERVDLVHTHHTPAFVDATIGTRLVPVPLVNTDHCKAYPTSRRWRWLERTASRFAGAFVAVSEDSRSDLIRHQGISERKLTTIYNGLARPQTSVDTFASLRRDLGIGADELIVGTAARLEAQKGLDLLLDAAPAVLDAVPNARFVIVGSGSEHAALRHHAQQRGIGARVLFTGFRLDAADLIGTFDCFVQTSYWEGMPMTLLEAMALQKPIVATAVGGVPEVVEDGVTGALLPERDCSLLSKLIVDVLANPTVAREMGRAGYERFLARFTAEQMASRYEALYEDVLNQWHGDGSQ
jgi:glycosyltransferase involved in cell wall biosynthesis